MGALFHKSLCGLNSESKTTHFLAAAMLGVRDMA